MVDALERIGEKKLMYFSAKVLSIIRTLLCVAFAGGKKSKNDFIRIAWMLCSEYKVAWLKTKTK
jgi:hypothetical protein